MARLVATIVGTGYVGLGYAAGFTMKGIRVNCVDLNPKIVELINAGKSPIDEPGMDGALEDAQAKDLIHATTNLKDIAAESDAFFICVGTYCDAEGNIDLSQIRGAAKSIGGVLKDAPKYQVVCVKSTVIPGTTDGVILPILEKESGKKVGNDFGLCMSPEFLREGNALEDITSPDKIVIGGYDTQAINLLKEFFRDFKVTNDQPIIETDLRTAELIKYAQNAFLATKISFINEISNLAELFGVNVGDVARAIGLDKRISPMFLNAGAGFGGSCFPKDVQALLSAAKKLQFDAPMLEATLEVNRRQKEHPLELLEILMPVSGKKIAILGLAFKPNTGDTREAVALTVIKQLLDKKAGLIRVFDPSSFAMEEIRSEFGDLISYATSIDDCLRGTNACLLLTEWDAFKKLKPTDFLAAMQEEPVIIDARRIYDEKKFQAAGIRIRVLGQSSNRDFVPQ